MCGCSESLKSSYVDSRFLCMCVCCAFVCLGLSESVQKETANLAIYLDSKTDRQKNNLFRL